MTTIMTTILLPESTYTKSFNSNEIMEENRLFSQKYQDLFEQYNQLEQDKNNIQQKQQLERDASVSPSSPTDNDEWANDQHHLVEINGQIKATLTSLLNCDSVKHDEALRSWVQGKLMDNEKNSRQQRRLSLGRSDKDVKSIEMFKINKSI